MKFLLLLTLLFTISGFQLNDADKNFKTLSAIAGTWKMETSKGTLYEEWQVINENLLAGRGYKLKGNDTIILENVRLEKKNGNVFYIPTVSNQNNRLPVSFAMISSSNAVFIFENKEHDFPQRIIYRLISKDSLAARIEGSKGGKINYSEFNYTRLK